MITLNEKQYDEEEFNKEQRQLLKAIMEIEGVLRSKQYELDIFMDYKNSLVTRLQASLEETSEETPEEDREY